MCEKPAGVYTAQVREMNEAADRHPELAFGMMFNQRTNCVYRKLKELLDERIWCASCKAGFDKPPVGQMSVETDGSNPQHVGVLNAFADHITYRFY